MKQRNVIHGKELILVAAVKNSLGDRSDTLLQKVSVQENMHICNPQPGPTALF